MIKRMDQESSLTPMGLPTTAAGRTTKPMATASLYILNNIAMKANGRTIFNTAKEKKFGLTVLFSRVGLRKASKTEKDFICGPMVQALMVTGNVI